MFFTNSGAEANEGAIKLARKWGRRFKEGAHEIITFDGAFHGRTLATMSASGKPGWDTMFAPQVPGFPRAAVNDLASVEALMGPRTAAVMLEPVQGESGVVPARVEFLRDLRALTRRRHCLLIVDEVQTGIGRTGRLFGYQHFARSPEEAPDVMTLGKGLGGGVPLAALCATEAVSVFEHGEQGGTFNGSPLMTAVGAAVLEVVLAPGFLDGVAERGRYLSARLGEMAPRSASRTSGGGGSCAHSTSASTSPAPSSPTPVTPWRSTKAGKGRDCCSTRRARIVLRFMPALNVTEDEIDRMLAGLRLSLEAVR